MPTNNQTIQNKHSFVVLKHGLLKTGPTYLTPNNDKCLHLLLFVMRSLTNSQKEY
ncbi:hypothetical protein MAMP_02314 [Methylophaga aminisulfidivorans MP]|uniref:Uncharacterized protein n=1 Tax=Methylophaga aminisulfidivorans MP TaxID=1026882 RepID=F5SXU0_9GAMM|nr:hypothetical protein MAMP_02314 [Methylophaga aminisulfidivorans MP]